MLIIKVAVANRVQLLRILPSQGSSPSLLIFQESKKALPKKCFFGGNNRARTYDPLLVRQMLSQLSYASIFALATDMIIAQ